MYKKIVFNFKEASKPSSASLLNISATRSTLTSTTDSNIYENYKLFNQILNMKNYNKYQYKH